MHVQQQQAILKEAMDLHGDELLRLCYTYVRNWQTAEDLTQEAFLKLYEALPHFRGEASVKTYVYRIAINCCHNYLKSWKHKKVVVTTLMQQWLTTEKTPETELLKEQQHAHLMTLIENLSPKYKDVLLLYHFAEFSLEQCSEALTLPVNTIKTRLRRARQQLGLELQKEERAYDY